MKILYVMAGGEHGGAETAFVDIALAMHEAGEHVEVATRANDIRVPRFEKAGVKVHILSFGGKLDVFTPLYLKRIVQEFQPDIVQTWLCRAASQMPKWKPSMKIPPYVNVGRLGKDYNLKYFNNMDYFVAITPALTEHIKNNGVDESLISLIPNFAEVEDVDAPINRADYGTPEGAPLVLGLGRLHDDKAFDVLIKAVVPLPDVHVWIAGEGPLHQELQELIDGLELSARVKLLGWRTDRAALFQAADICAFISRAEGFGTVFIQSWAQKTPLITSDVNGPIEYVQNGEDGLMVKIDDIEATTQAIDTLCKDPALAAQLVERGYERYCNEFKKEICVQRYLEFYHSVRGRVQPPR